MQLLFRETVPALFTRPETDECGHLWTACSGTGHHVFRHEGTQFPNLFQPVRNNGKQAVSLPRSRTSLFAAVPGAEEHPAGAPRQSNPCRHLKRLHIKQEKPGACNIQWHGVRHFTHFSILRLFCRGSFPLPFSVSPAVSSTMPFFPTPRPDSPASARRRSCHSLFSSE